jgi:glycosyltransferase involved in cell wall biosynthesis
MLGGNILKNEKEIKISVIIPVYNGEQYVATCIEALQNQTMQTGYELIFVDDGSTDKTLEIIRSYAEQDSRICFFSQENKGISAARNLGMDNCKGEWIVFVDVDDEIASEYLQDISREIEADSTAPVLVYARHYVEKDRKVIDNKKFTRKQLICSLLTEETIEELGTDFLLFAAWSKVYKKTFLQDNNITFVEGLRWAEDMVFQCYVFQCAEEIRFIYRGYYRYVQHSNSTIHAARKDDTKTIKKMQTEIKRALSPLWKDEDIRTAYYLGILNRWFIAISSELNAWKLQESLSDSYKRLKRILQEDQLNEIVDSVKKSSLNKKEKVKLFLLKKLPLCYLMIIRKVNV